MADKEYSVSYRCEIRFDDSVTDEKRWPRRPSEEELERRVLGLILDSVRGGDPWEWNLGDEESWTVECEILGVEEG